MRGYELQNNTLIPAKPEPKKEIERISIEQQLVILWLLVCAIVGVML